MMDSVLVYFRRCKAHILVFVAILATFYILIMVNSMYYAPISDGTKHKEYESITNMIKSVNFKSHKRDHKRAFFISSPEKFNQTINKSKLILLWSPLFNGSNFLIVGKDSFQKSNCLESRCEITSDRNRFLECDAVLFHVRTMSLMDVPRNRASNQKWIFFSLEAPPYSHFQGFSFMSGMFNWTMTYRNDSDVVIRYGRIARNASQSYSEPLLYSQWSSKTKMAVWMVSHCSTVGNREEYIKEMENYIDVTTYGECGVAVCIFNKTNRCLENFSKRFFFYLAFENAICNEYITEKFYRILNYNMIPVVFGGGKYSDIAPSNSYINALEFDSPRELSSHLLRVASNFSLFASYFKWRLDGYEVQDTPNHCDLCEKLHSASFVDTTVYEDMNRWWIRKSHCRRWKKS